MPGLDGKEPTRDELNAEAVAQGLGDFVIEGLTKAEQVAVLKAADIYRTKLGEQLALAKAEADAVSAAAQAAIDNANSAIANTDKAIAVAEALQAELADAKAQAARDLEAAQADAGRAVLAAQADARKAREAAERAIAIAEAKAATPIPEGKGLGGLPGSSVLVLMTVNDADHTWRRPQDVNSTWVVDFTGPNAHFLATRCRRPLSQLEDGTWRIQADNQPQAANIWNEANVWCRDQGDTVTKIERGPKGSDSMLARDAVRGTPIAAGPGRILLASPRGWSVSSLPDGSVLLRQA